jgi:DNA polymerase-3 subunit gamma/tau
MQLISSGSSVVDLAKDPSASTSAQLFPLQQSTINNQQSTITNHQSPITNNQSPITNHQ